MDFKKSFCWRSNLSNVNIIPAYARSENGCGKCHFLVSNRVRIWRPKNGIFPPPHQQFPGATPPLAIPPRSSRKVFDVGSPVLGSTNKGNLKNRMSLTLRNLD